MYTFKKYISIFFSLFIYLFFLLSDFLFILVACLCTQNVKIIYLYCVIDWISHDNVPNINKVMLKTEPYTSVIAFLK